VGCLCLISFYAPSSPNTSQFSEIDITSKGSIQFVGASLDDLAKTTRSYGLGNGMSKDIVRAIRGKRVYCGACPGPLGEKVILLVMEKGQVDILNESTRYRAWGSTGRVGKVVTIEVACGWVKDERRQICT
jgi:hypothetical protein